MNTQAIADAQEANRDIKPWIERLLELGPPPPQPTPAERQAADADIPFYKARVDMNKARIEELCASLAKTPDDAQALPAVNHFFARYFKDDDELLRRFPSHSNFIREMDFGARMLQQSAAPEYFRRVCSARRGLPARQ
jgi:hypothetical protein